MNRKIFFAMILLAVTLLTLFACAKEAEQDSSETAEEETAEEIAEDYSPVVVDDLTQDFEEMGW